MCHFTAKLPRLPRRMIVLINDRGELYIMVTLGEEQAVTEAKSCSERSACACECMSVCTSAYVWTHMCCVVCLPGCWRAIVFDSELVSWFVLDRETLKMIR